jgi:hypothetical protein
LEKNAYLGETKQLTIFLSTERCVYCVPLVKIKVGANSAPILKERIPEIRRLVCRKVGRGVDTVHWIMVEILQKCKFQRR